MKISSPGSPQSTVPIVTIRPTYAEGSIESPGMPEGGRLLEQYESGIIV